MDKFKTETQRQWSLDPCGANTAGDAPEGSRAYYDRVEKERYDSYAPWMQGVMPFSAQGRKRVLEIGPGLGTDHIQFARGGAEMYGVDLTARHLELTRMRFSLEGRATHLAQADAETLPFCDDSFDLVYSFGVLHHTPGTDIALNEAHRVLKPGGQAIISLYHKHSAYYWLQTILLRGILLGGLITKGHYRLLSEIEYRSPSSTAIPLVKVFSRRQCRRLFQKFSSMRLRTDHIEPSHLFPPLGRIKGLRRFTEQIGRGFGWYITVFAVK